jgi:PKD repeat protein
MIHPYLTHFRLPRLLLCLMLSGSYLWAQPCITTYPYIEDFEASNGGWTSTSLNPSVLSSWVWAPIIANPIINAAASGTACWVTGNNPFLAFPQEPFSYFPGEQSVVTSPCFDFSGLVNPGIKFNIWWESESRTDGTRFQYSTNGGVSWNNIGTVGDAFNWYNDTAIVAHGGNPGWSGDTSVSPNSPLRGSDGWVNAQRGLTFLAGQPDVRFRFVFASDLNPDTTSIMDGFAFDDVVVGDRPVINLGNDTTLCFAQATTLSMCHPQGASYSWSTNPLDTNCVLLVAQPNTYIGFLVDTLGFFVTDTIEIQVSSTFINLGPNQTICPGDTITLSATNSASTYQWNPGGQTTGSIEVFATGQYRVTVSDTLGCATSDSVNILVDPIPEVDLGPDTTICAGSTIALNAGTGPPGTLYDWDPISASTQTVLVASPGTYSVDVLTLNGCTATDTVQIGVSLFPLVDLGPDRSVCDSVRLNAGNVGATYQWSPSLDDTLQFYTVTSPGTYYVDVINQFGCATSDTVSLTITTAPSVSLGPDTFFCPGQAVVLNAGLSGLRYFWSNGDTTQTTSVNTPGRYTVRVSSGPNCSGRDTIQVIRSTIAVDLGADRTLCAGDSLVLDAGPVPDNYLWSTSATSQAITVTQANTYSVAVRDTLGCEATDQVVVTLQPGPQATLDITGDPNLFSLLNFAGQSSGTPVSWSWTFGDGDMAMGQNVSHTYVSTGTFQVCLTVDDGTCTTTICESINIGVVGLWEHPDVKLALFPNPTDRWLQLDLSLPVQVPIQASLQDLAGRQLWQQDWGTQQAVSERFDLGPLPAGLYFLRLDLGQEAFFLKVRRQ